MKRKVQPKKMEKLRKILYAKNITQGELGKAVGLSQQVINKILCEKMSFNNLEYISKIANFLNLSIEEIFSTGSKQDEKNRFKLQMINTIFNDYKIIGKLRKRFNRNELQFMTEMLKDKEFPNPGLPRHFLINTILETDYYTQLSIKYKINAAQIADKIDTLNEMEAFALLNKILEYNINNEQNIDKLLL